MAQSEARAHDLSPVRLKQVLHRVAASFSEGKQRRTKRVSDGDQDSSFALSEFVASIPSLIHALETLQYSQNTDCTSRAESLLSQVHHFAVQFTQGELQRCRNDKDRLLAELQEAEQRYEDAVADLRLAKWQSAELLQSAGKSSLEADSARKELEEKEQHHQREKEYHAETRRHLSQENAELREQLNSVTSRIAAMQLRQSSLKHALSKSKRRASDLECSLSSLTEQCQRAEAKAEHLDRELSRSQKKAQLLEEELSFRSDYVEREEAVGDEEVSDFGRSFREEIEHSARAMTLGEEGLELAEEELFGRPQLVRRRTRLSVSLIESDRQQFLFRETQLCLQSHLMECECVGTQHSTWRAFPCVALALAVLCTVYSLFYVRLPFCSFFATSRWETEKVRRYTRCDGDSSSNMSTDTPILLSLQSTNRTTARRSTAFPQSSDIRGIRSRRFTVARAVVDISRESDRQDTWQEQGPSFQQLIKLESRDGNFLSFESHSVEYPVVQTAGVSSTLFSSLSDIVKTHYRLPGLDIRRQRTIDTHLPKHPDMLDEEVLKSTVDIRSRTPFERVDVYEDQHPLLPYRKAAMRLDSAVRQGCRIIVGNMYFETFIILVILWNTVLLALEDPSYSVQPEPYNSMETTLLYIYTVEMGLKILAFGFVIPPMSYIRDPWNILDFIIVVTGWIEYEYAGSGVNLTALRALRILRPLRSVTRIHGMRVIFLSLVGSIKLLIGSMALLFFFYLVVSIASLQMFMGTLRYRCMDMNTGIISLEDEEICGARTCSYDSTCSSGLINPIYGTSHFDNLLLSMLTVFQCVTLEGWVPVMNMLEEAISMWIVFFFIPIIFLGAYFFMNMTLVAMKSSVRSMQFSKAMNEVMNRKAKKQVLEEALEAEIQETTLKASASPDTLAEVPRNDKQQAFKAIKDADFFTLASHQDIKMRQNILSLEPQDLNPNISISSQDQILLEKDEFSISSSALRESEQVERVSSVNVSAFPVLQAIEEVAELPLSFRNQGKSILMENPSFSEVDVSKVEVRKSMLEPIPEAAKSELKTPEEMMNELISTPEEDILKLPFFFRKRQQFKRLKAIDVTFQVSELDSRNYSSEADVRSLQATPETHDSHLSAFSYIDPRPLQNTKPEGPEGHSTTLFSQFLSLSIRYTAKIAYKRLLPLSRTTVNEHFAQDIASTQRREGHWSGFDLSPNFDSASRMQALNTMKYRLWRRGCFGIFQRALHPCRVIAEDKRYFESFMTLCVVLNTIVLGINHYQIDNETLSILDTLNLMFTIIFAVEMTIKLAGLGIVGYFRLKMNIFDCIIVVLSILEVTFLSDSGVSGLSAIRIFRAFRVLRVARLLRWMPYMQRIMIKISESASKFMYLGLLLLLFIVVFALFGMQLFGGKFSFEDADRSNYDNFNFAFMATFQILTTENWHLVLHNGMRAVGTQASIYFIIWLFLGNFILLNLFLAILLDAFEEDSEDPLQAITTTLTSEKSAAKLGKSPSNTGKSSISRKKMESIKKKIEEIEQESIQSASNSIDSVFDAPKEKELYEGNKCERSFFIFSRNNSIRKQLYRLTSSQGFEKFIMVVIALSSLKLIWETYLLKEPTGSVKLEISDNIDTVFTCLFAAELVAKATALGFVLDQGTYLREAWNVLDCFIVTFSLIDLGVSGINLPIIKVFRLLRALRPLRFISHNISMRIIVSALLESMGVLAHVTLVMLIVWLIFAILGVSLFAGKMYTCSFDGPTTRSECEYYGGNWVNAPYHFDSVLDAMVTLFDLTSPENWNDTMYRAMDTSGKEVAMRKNASPLYGYYIIVFLVVSNFFFLNLFLGVMFDKFEKAKRENTSISEMLLLPEQYRWLEMMKLVIKTKQKVESVVVDVGAFRTAVCALVAHWAFTAFIIFCIIANMVVMGMAYQEMSPTYSLVLENLNYSFTAVFTLEAVLKIVGLGSSYFKESWNQFDFFVVAMSLLDIVLSNTVFSRGTNKMMTVGPQLARTLRVLRVSRMLRLVKSLQIMDDLIGMLALSLPAMINVLALLALVFVIFGVLGVFLFHTIESGLIIDDYNNFSNFGMSVLILIRASTGEDWNYMLVDCSEQVNSWVTHLFFFSFVCITTFIMYNMFVMVMLQEYENYQTNPNSSFKLFKMDLAEFNRAWNLAADQKSPGKLDSTMLFTFAFALNDISSHKDKEGKVVRTYTKYEVRKKLGAMGILPDEHGFVYYHDVLFKFIRMKHGIYSKGKTKYSKKILEKEELFYTKRLRKIVKLARTNSSTELQATAKGDMKFFDILFLKTVFSSWRKWTLRRRDGSASVTPPMSLNFPGANSEHSDEGEEPEVALPVNLWESALNREFRTSRMSTNFSKNRTDTQE